MPGPLPPQPISAVPYFSDGGMCGAPKIWRGSMVAAVAPVVDLLRKLLLVSLACIYFMNCIQESYQ